MFFFGSKCEKVGVFPPSYSSFHLLQLVTINYHTSFFLRSFPFFPTPNVSAHYFPRNPVSFKMSSNISYT